MRKVISLLLALMMCTISCLAMAETGVIGGADGPTAIVVSGPDFVLPGDLEAAALAAGRKGTSTLAVTEVAGVNTGNAELDAALTDLIKALGFTSSVQGDETEFALTISGTDVLSLGLAVNEDDVYLKSNLLGGAVVVGADEAETLLNRLVDMLVMLEALTEEDAAMFREMFGSLAEVIPAAMQNEAFDTTLTGEDLLALDFTAVAAALETVMAKTQTVENPVVPKNCDPAVSGMILNASNDDMLLIARAIIQFVKDNPKLMAYLGTQLGISTEAQLSYMWDALQDASPFENEAEMRENNLTIEQLLDEILAELEDKKLLDGDYVININMDEAGIPVYMTFTLPLFIEQEGLYTSEAGMNEAVSGETVLVELIYARQTVAQGVSHVINLAVDGETLTVDTLVSGSTAHIVLSVPDEEPVIIDAEVQGNALTARLTYNPDEETAIACTFDGSYLYSETKYVLEGKITLEETFVPAETETPSHNGLTLPGFEKYKPTARTNTLALAIKMDYDLDGVDFTGVTDIMVDVNDVHIALQAKSFTSEPDQSIMAENVVRPAELDDAAFANWFVGVVNTISSWTGNLLMALPESLLSMLMYSGM